MSEPGAASPLVGIVVVSHSRRLAEGVVELARQMAGDDVALEAVGGAPDGSLGTDADGIAAAIGRADRGAGVVIVGRPRLGDPRQQDRPGAARRTGRRAGS